MRTSVVMVLLAVLAVGGCSTPELMILSKAPPLPSEYKIGPGDSVWIEFRMHPEYNRQLTVGPHGKVNLPSIGEFVIYSKTEAATSAELTKLYSEIFTEPDVLVSVVGFGSKLVYVAGEVGSPGVVPYAREMRLLDAVMLAGGPTLRAEKSCVKLVRMSLDSPQVVICDLGKVIMRGEKLHNPRLNYGDVIYVPPTIPTWFGYKLNEILFPITSLFTGIEQSSSAKFTLRNFGGEGVGR